MKFYDVIVVGGGPSGICAAVAAAREGAHVALIERYGILGGMLTSGYVNPILGRTGAGTMYHEVVSLIERGHEDAEKTVTRNGSEIHVDTEEAKSKLLSFVHESGADIYLQTPVVDVEKAGDTLTGVVVGTQDGPETFCAKVFVDATGDGFLSSRAGAPYKIGRDSDGKCQPVTHEFIIGDVDESVAISCFGGSDPVTLPNGKKYSELCREASERGELPKNVTIVRLHKTFYKGERSVNATQANGYDTLTPEGVLGAELELRRQTQMVVEFLRKNVIGYENCRVKAGGSTLGVRETRRITGDKTVVDADVENGNHYEDAVVHDAWFLIDIHNPTGGGQAEKHSQPCTPYDIPYGCLIPKNIEGLLTAGRCISGTHRAHATYRVMGIAMATGEAAGVAAALSAKLDVTPRELDVKLVQKALIDKGVDLGETVGLKRKIMKGKDYYFGHFYNGEINGYGEYHCADGGIYKGTFKDGKFHGKGELTAPDGERYIGEFKNDLREGRGEHSYKNGDRYDGEFKNGLYHGEGVFTWANGASFVGTFENGIRSSGTFTGPDGKKSEVK